MEGFNLVATIKNLKKSGININKKINGINVNRKNVEDDEKNNKNSTLDTKSVIIYDTNVLNLREADKSVRKTTSVLYGKIGKRVSNIDKNVGKVGKRVGNANKSVENIIFDFFREVEKRVLIIKVLKIAYPFLLRSLEKELVIILWPTFQ